MFQSCPSGLGPMSAIAKLNSTHPNSQRNGSFIERRFRNELTFHANSVPVIRNQSIMSELPVELLAPEGAS